MFDCYDIIMNIKIFIVLFVGHICEYILCAKFDFMAKIKWSTVNWLTGVIRHKIYLKCFGILLGTRGYIELRGGY